MNNSRSSLIGSRLNSAEGSVEGQDPFQAANRLKELMEIKEVLPGLDSIPLRDVSFTKTEKREEEKLQELFGGQRRSLEEE